MTCSDEETRRLLKRVEDSELEFQRVVFEGDRPIGPKRDDWADEIAAFANTDGGVILCSVTDDGEIISMPRKRVKALEQLLAEICYDTIKPPVPIRAYCREPERDKAVLLVEVPQGDALHGSPGGYFHRVGSSKRKMNSKEALRLAQRRSQAKFFRFGEQLVPGANFGTLSEALWRPLLSAAEAENPEAALEKLALLALDESGTMCATAAGILLCSKHPERHPPNACITAIRYRGEDCASGQIDGQEITGPLDQQIVMAMNFVIRNMSVTTRKISANVNLPQYSEQAVFEALVNAAVHRDYTIRGSRIYLSMFSDRLELQSPGKLPHNLSIGSMGDRQTTRNEALTSALSRMQVSGISGSRERGYLLTRRGDGVPIIWKETLRLCGQPPLYELIDGTALRLTLPAAFQGRASMRAAATDRGAGAKLMGRDFSPCSPAIPGDTRPHPALGE